jgi:hypothetical protein
MGLKFGVFLERQSSHGGKRENKEHNYRGLFHPCDCGMQVPL